jgi:tetratricopeptide (TPR) repeat protein
MPDLAGAVVGDRYRLERELGRGGMATVWLARDLDHERPVAVKVIHPELAGAIGIDRFVREVRLTGRLQHPNIVQLLDSGSIPTPDGQALPWYAMPYLEGESLRTRLARERQLPIEEALGIAGAVGAALSTAHDHGIVHRDIKPDNVFLSGAHVYVVDFGIAKALIDTEAERLTSTGLAIGTPSYMSPEQSMAAPMDARSDQYSLAAVLYEMLAGEPPFSGPTAQAIVARRFAEAARAIRPVRSTVPEHVERAVLRALERAPADRFPDVAAFIAALGGEARPSATRRARPMGSRWQWFATGVLVLVAGGGWFVASRARGARAPVVRREVMTLYQRGVLEYERRTPVGNSEAVAAFGAAIELDSTFAPAWAGLAKAHAQAHGRAFVVGARARDSLLQRALAAANRAMTLDPESADGWLARALVSRLVDPTDAGPVLRAVRRSLALDSTDLLTWRTYGVALLDSGDVEAGTDIFRACVHRGPTHTECLAFLALAHYWSRQYDSATVWADSAVAVDPNYLLGRQSSGNIAVERGDFVRAEAAFDAASRIGTDVEYANALAGGALAEARAGRLPEARALLRTADSLGAAYMPNPHTAVYVAQAHAALGDADQALAWLGRYEPRRDVHFQLHLRCDPPFDPLRNHERFRALLVMPSPSPGQGC